MARPGLPLGVPTLWVLGLDMLVEIFLRSVRLTTYRADELGLLLDNQADDPTHEGTP